MKIGKNVHYYNFTELKEISKRKSNVQCSRIFFWRGRRKRSKNKKFCPPFWSCSIDNCCILFSTFIEALLFNVVLLIQWFILDLWQELGATFPQEDTKWPIEDIHHSSNLELKVMVIVYIETTYFPTYFMSDIKSKLLSHHNMPATAKTSV